MTNHAVASERALRGYATSVLARNRPPVTAPTYRDRLTARIRSIDRVDAFYLLGFNVWVGLSWLLLR